MSRTDSLQNCEECLEPADAFSVVGNETRLAILEALWRIETPARFSDVREEVGTTDSAQFNYHLGKLTDQFVRKAEEVSESEDSAARGTESHGGYELRTAGERVVQAILAGSFTEHPDREIDIDDPCIHCGATLSAHYEDEMLAIECPDCGHGHGEYPFPPGGLHDRTDEEVLEAFDQRVRHLHCLANDGVCPECNGRMVTTIERGGECCLGAALRAEHGCRQCHHELCSAIGLGLLDHSAVAGFYDDHGVAISETPYWQFEWCVDDTRAEVLQEDPAHVEIEIPHDGETLRVVVDEDLAVVETERL
jgi:DNA-directed RNA polymerase subunit RPC12/RpoP/DNA-binding HxlR family transcriptional regulator